MNNSVFISVEEQKRKEIEMRIDVIEDNIAEIDPMLLKLLLKDKTTRKNILWCTKDYEYMGSLYGECECMSVESITGIFSNTVHPRASKSKIVQERRIKKRAEVFTPSWICNIQNNQIDEAWFGRPNVFNVPNGTGWITTSGRIEFPIKTKTWKAYVNARRLEITCGEAPYLVSRYDTTTGELIPLYERIGLFDRKMRIVNENCIDDDEWIKWSFHALKCVYGYEIQGDSLLIARENLLLDYIDYYKDKFNENPPITLLRKAATIISWNLWQMDGLKGVVPYSCHDVEEPNYQTSVFDNNTTSVPTINCPGCEKNDTFKHTGKYCYIYDWININNKIRFVDMYKEED